MKNTFHHICVLLHSIARRFHLPQINTVYSFIDRKLFSIITSKIGQFLGFSPLNYWSLHRKCQTSTGKAITINRFTVLLQNFRLKWVYIWSKTMQKKQTRVWIHVRWKTSKPMHNRLKLFRLALLIPEDIN